MSVGFIIRDVAMDEAMTAIDKFIELFEPLIDEMLGINEFSQLKDRDRKLPPLLTLGSAGVQVIRIGTMALAIREKYNKPRIEKYGSVSSYLSDEDTNELIDVIKGGHAEFMGLVKIMTECGTDSEEAKEAIPNLIRKMKGDGNE